ncbi:MAG TPA: GDP-mannose 4,6-dehydratase [Gaiellaceae bacterium]|nr:GDP-mannose 4,6-dehydratase [Gaiellaceae bacterium]
MSGPVLVTGAGGFVGRHLLAELGGRAVAGRADVTDGDALAAELREVAPAAVCHLAAATSVAESWRRGAETWRVNVLGTVALLDAVCAEAPEARTLVVSTGEVYGPTPDGPAGEDTPVAPLSPYAASKAAAELAATRAARAEKLDVVVARPFQHAGPGQDERFAIGSWTARIARLERAGGGELEVGDLTVRRDLTDVRDVTRAYRLLLDPATPAGTYNVCSGRTVELATVLDTLVRLAREPVEVRDNPALRRPVDVPVLAGDPARLEAATGWRAEIPLEQTLADALDEARRRAAEEDA